MTEITQAQSVSKRVGPFLGYFELCERVFLFNAGLLSGFAIMAASERLMWLTLWLAGGAAAHLSTSLWTHSALKVCREGTQRRLASVLSWVSSLSILFMLVTSLVAFRR